MKHYLVFLIGLTLLFGACGKEELNKESIIVSKGKNNDNHARPCDRERTTFNPEDYITEYKPIDIVCYDKEALINDILNEIQAVIDNCLNQLYVSSPAFLEQQNGIFVDNLCMTPCVPDIENYVFSITCTETNGELRTIDIFPDGSIESQDNLIALIYRAAQNNKPNSCTKSIFKIQNIYYESTLACPCPTIANTNSWVSESGDTPCSEAHLSNANIYVDISWFCCDILE